MNKKSRIKVFLIDDDVLYLKALQIDFEAQGDYIIKTFNSGEECIANLDDLPDVIVLDYHLDGVIKDAMNGIQTLDKIKVINTKIPVIILSSQDKIEVAVNCMHHKAFDYVVKSETAFLRLHKLITTNYRFQKLENELKWYMDRM
jgi:DNA-binding NtrC family response regulator